MCRLPRRVTMSADLSTLLRLWAYIPTGGRRVLLGAAYLLQSHTPLPEWMASKEARGDERAA